MYIKQVNKQVYSITKILSVTQYVFSIILKWKYIFELDYVLIHFVD